MIPLSGLSQLLKIVQAAFPREASGMILNHEITDSKILYFEQCSFNENTPFTFCIRNFEIERVTNSIIGTNKKIVGCFHSHVFGKAIPSSFDIAASKLPGDLWAIYSVKYSDLRMYKWNGFKFENQPFQIKNIMY